MKIALSARISILFLSLLLLIPTAAIPLQSHISLEQFHNRSLSKWPLGKEFLGDPVQYFTKCKRWFADRAYPIIAASFFQKKFLLYIMNTPPQRRLTMGSNGFVFLNGTDDDHVNNIFESVCIHAHSQTIGEGLQRSLNTISLYSKVNGTPIDVILFPTLETLYGDRLPLSVPYKYRLACGEGALGKSPLSEIQAPSPLHYIYPFAQMHRARDDDALFPKGNYHPDGLSLQIVRDAYLSSLGVNATIDETLRRTTGPSELLLQYGINWKLPVYRINDSNVLTDNDATLRLGPAISDLFANSYFETHAFNNAHAADPETVLMLSDSYGGLAAQVFAGGFRRLIQVTINDMRPHEIIELIARISGLFHVDRVVLFFQEGNVDCILQYREDFK